MNPANTSRKFVNKMSLKKQLTVTPEEEIRTRKRKSKAPEVLDTTIEEGPSEPKMVHFSPLMSSTPPSPPPLPPCSPCSADDYLPPLPETQPYEDIDVDIEVVEDDDDIPPSYDDVFPPNRPSSLTVRQPLQPLPRPRTQLTRRVSEHLDEDGFLIRGPSPPPSPTTPIVERCPLLKKLLEADDDELETLPPTPTAPKKKTPATPRRALSPPRGPKHDACGIFNLLESYCGPSQHWHPGILKLLPHHLQRLNRYRLWHLLCFLKVNDLPKDIAILYMEENDNFMDTTIYLDRFAILDRVYESEYARLYYSVRHDGSFRNVQTMEIINLTTKFPFGKIVSRTIILFKNN